jgi:hypothetical protein
MTDRLRLAALLGFAQQFADEPCTYKDDCPTFGSRHGTCLPCQARRALAEPAEPVAAYERHLAVEKGRVQVQGHLVGSGAVFCDPTTLSNSQLIDTVEACQDEYDKRAGLVRVPMDMEPAEPAPCPECGRDPHDVACPRAP